MSKKSVVTITVMACLLAVAVATTIVLAAFSANKTATTTVTFANGVKIQVIGAYTENSNTADIESQTAANLVWANNVNLVSNEYKTDVTNVAENVTFEAVSFKNSSTSGDSIWLVAKATVAPDSDGPTSAITNPTTRSGWVQLGSSDWYAYSNTASAANVDAVTFTALAAGDTAAFIPANSVKIACNDASAGKKYNAEIVVYAVSATASDALATLKANATGIPVASGS